MFGSSTTTNHSPPTLAVVETGSVLPTSTSSIAAVSCSPARPTTTTTTNRPSAAKPNTNVFASPTNLRKSFQSLLNSTIQGSNNNNNHTSMAYHHNNNHNINKKNKNGPRRNSSSSTSSTPSVKTMEELAVVPHLDEILSQVRVTPETIQRVVQDTRQFAHIQAQLRKRQACTNTLAAALHVRLIRQGEQELQQRQAKAQQQVALLEQINQVNQQLLVGGMAVGSASNHHSTRATTSGAFKDIMHLDSLQEQKESSSFSCLPDKNHARLGKDHNNGNSNGSSSSSSSSPKTVVSWTEFTPSAEAHFLVNEEEYYQAFLKDNNAIENNHHPNDDNITRDVSPSWTARSVTTMILQSP